MAKEPEKNDFYKRRTQPYLTSGQEGLTPIELPEKIGPYKIEALLNKGGMSYLYLGTHPETKEPLTIKVLSKKHLSNTEIVQHFLNEAEIISMTNHPNIIKMFGHGEWEGGLYIAMEYIEGVSLRNYIIQNPLSLKRALGIIIDIAYALCHLHTHGVIHRDLKPENILVTKDDSIKVIDFGISQILTTKTSPDESGQQRLIGTPIYMSPEQKENPEAVSYPSDIYSLGIIAYELILGRLSHGHVHLSLMPKGIQPILHKCLQPNSKNRYQDIVDFITDVSGYLNSTDLQKDRILGDQLSELSEEFRQIQMTLTPSQPPEWPGFEIGISSFKNLGDSGTYYEFFRLSDDVYGVIMGDPSSKGAESYITTANFRGMIKALYQKATNPKEFITSLNDLLFKDKLGPFFNLNYLLFKPKENLHIYITCGYGNLWYLPCDSNTPENCSTKRIALGSDAEAEFEEATTPWNVGDILLLNSFSSFELPVEETKKWRLDEKEFVRVLKDNVKIPPQQQADNILLKTRLVEREALQDKSISFISIKRIAG